MKKRVWYLDYKDSVKLVKNKCVQFIKNCISGIFGFIFLIAFFKFSGFLNDIMWNNRFSKIGIKPYYYHSGRDKVYGHNFEEIESRFKYKFGSIDSESASWSTYGNEISFTLGTLIIGSFLLWYYFGEFKKTCWVCQTFIIIFCFIQLYLNKFFLLFL